MAVNTEHGEWSENQPLWQLVRDCVKGETAIKAATKKYLPQSPGQSDKAYDLYLTNAHFSNYTGRTAESMHGQVFSQFSEHTNVPQNFKEFLDNVDNAGASLNKFASEVCWDILPTGWGGILVDHTTWPEGYTGDRDQASRERLRLVSYLKYYNAESLINWRYDVVNNKTVLAMVVLRETYEDNTEDEFTPVERTRYRVLRLMGGFYLQQVYVQVEKEWVGLEPIVPLMDNQPLDHIPFFPCPSPTPDKSLLLDLAYENISHYQMSASNKNALHLMGAPTLWMAADENKWPRDDKGKVEPIRVGGDVAIMLPEGATMGYAEINGNGIGHARKEIDASEQHMKDFGARVTSEPRRGVEAAETARINQAGTNSVLGAFAVNMSEIITNAVRLAARWRGITEDAIEAWKFDLNTDYSGDVGKIEEKKLGLNMVMDGLMSKYRFLIEHDGMTEEAAAEEMERIRLEGEFRYEPADTD